MSGRWRAPIYDHGKFGPLGAEVMEQFERASRTLFRGTKVHVACSCGRFSSVGRDKMVKHLTELHHCYINRTRAFWTAKPEFAEVSGRVRRAQVISEAGIQVWRDVGAMTKKPLKSVMLGVRVGHTMTAKYQLWSEQWATAIMIRFYIRGDGLWKTANKNDWLLRAVLRRAKHNLEFRAAVTGLQRIASDPWVQHEAFQGWMKNSDTSNAKNM